MIKVEHLTKQYAATTALWDISFQVTRNEILGFLGPNGAGKSTTLKILTGYLAPTSGTAVVDGHDVFVNPKAVKKVIGYLPENVPLYTELRVDEYLGYRSALKEVPRNRRHKAIDSAIERCQLGDVRQRVIGQLSKGYRQRVGLADALLGDPKILILDEPTIGLDPNQIRQVRELIRELGRERTVILSSHILPEVEAVCSRVIIIHQGRLVSRGRPEDLRADLQGGGVTITVEVIDPGGAAQGAIEQVDGVTHVDSPDDSPDGYRTLVIKADPDPAVRERIFDAAVERGFKLTGLSSRGASLEDIFVQITTSEGDEPPAADGDAEGGAA